MGWNNRYGPITVHWDEPNPPHGTLPCFTPITQAEINALRLDLRQVLYDPCGFIAIDAITREYEAMNGIQKRKARYAQIRAMRSLHAEAKAAKGIRI